MPLVPFAKLRDVQKDEVYAMYPNWTAGPWEWYAFWIKPDGHLTKAKGRHELTYYGYIAWKNSCFSQSSNPEKGDISAWKPGVTFHFIRD
jgi:hypothetical protein